jgi:hypothetical protein
LSSRELARIGKLRRVLRLSSHGKGVAASIVESFQESRVQEEKEMVRQILLGAPAEMAVSGLVSNDDPSRDVLTYLVDQAKVNAVEASKRADRLTYLFERWLWKKQERLVDKRIMETRSLLVSAILGAVTAMVSVLAPVLASFQLALGTPPSQAAPTYLGVLFVIPASSFLGYFFSTRRALLNVGLSLLAYALVTYLFAPLVLAF